MSEETNVGGSQDEDGKNSEGPPHLSENLSEEIVTMWEIPQMYQFLCLAKDTLGIQHLSMYEMERMLLMPKASKQLGNIMTSLLSPPMPKSKLRTMPPMPYQFWTNLLTQKALGWFKVYQSKEGDSVKVLETIGVEPEFWKIFPHPELISDRKFDKLNLRERVWLLKTVCDTLIHSRRSLQDEIVRNYLDDDSEMVLGKDRHGARYIYFPIFLDNDLRVYRHCLDNKILLSLKHGKKEPKPKPEVTSEKKMVKRKRKSWRYGKLPTKSKKRAAKVDTDKIEKTEQEDKNDEGDQVDEKEKLEEEGKEDINEEQPNLQDKLPTEESKDEEKAEENDTPSAEPEGSAQGKDTSPPEERETPSLRDDLSNCSKTDDEKINEKRTASPVLPKNASDVSKSDDDKIIETRSANVEDIGKARVEGCEIIAKETEESTTSENNIGECISEKPNNTDDGSTPDTELNSATSVKSKKEIEEFKLMITDLGESNFRLVADTLDGLRDLVACFEALNYPEGPETAACEVQLIKKLIPLIRELEKIEAVLRLSKIEAKEKLQEEWNKFQEGDKENGGQPADGEKGSNAWIIGSQGCPMLANGDTLSQSSMEGQEFVEGGVKIKIEKKDPDEESNVSGPERETRRVLRRRGISSYLEPFFTSSEDSNPCDQDPWTGPEPPVTPTGAVSSPPEPPSRPRTTGEESTGEDSDQDWILPGSRKRRRKRSSPSKRNKSHHNKQQTINSHGSTTLHPASDPITIEAKTRLNPLNNASPFRPVNKIKITSVHSELDIKDEGPIIDNVTSGTADNSSNNGVQQNYVLVNTGNGPVNYVVMPQDNPQQQAPPMVSVVPPPVPQQNYMQGYIPGPGGYIVPHVTQYRSPYSNPSSLQPMIIQGGQVMQQPYMQQPGNYMQYQQVMPPMTVAYPGGMQPAVAQSMAGPGSQSLGGPALQHQGGPGGQSMGGHGPPSMPGHVQQSLTGPRPANRDLHIRATGSQPRHPVGAVIRSASVPFRGPPRPPVRRLAPNPRILPRGPRPQALRPQGSANRNGPSGGKPSTKTTSLIVLSDSDDEIEMIITEKSDGAKGGQRGQAGRQKPMITSEVMVPGKSVLSPQIIQRMNQGGISITPIKPKTVEKPTIAGGTQLVVVVNETGSHYALALPNGSKLILTPEQVAQIRASNGGKLIL